MVLKPVEDAVEAAWLADVLSGLHEDGFRVERPVRSAAGTWLVGGWSAWGHLSGVHDTSARRWPEVLRMGERLGAALRHLPRPGFLDARTHAWSIGDRVAWGEEPAEVHHAPLRALADRLLGHVRPDDAPNQVVDGDLTGNVLFAPGLAPAVIDVTPYWRPARFCLAVVVVDALLWHGAPARLVEELPGDEDRTSLLARAALFRLVASDRLALGQERADRTAYLRAATADHERVLGVLDATAP
ncbi:hypothetical protein [Geodermatophilus dictyosporus]|uniref:hypothetical protein n=1 Tax=Geodermatophilus dictyosporus TaxID=1523247 RepID=UPI00145C3A10|nr:hypothetical protein [Geodermatophilus dictyosporus]